MLDCWSLLACIMHGTDYVSNSHSIGLKRSFPRRTRSTSGRGSPPTRAFAGSKPLPYRFTSVPILYLTALYLRRQRSAALSIRGDQPSTQPKSQPSLRCSRDGDIYLKAMNCIIITLHLQISAAEWPCIRLILTSHPGSRQKVVVFILKHSRWTALVCRGKKSKDNMTLMCTVEHIGRWYHCLSVVPTPAQDINECRQLRGP